MPSIVIARFDTLPDAASAAHALVGDGFREDAVSVFRAAERRGERWPGPLVYAAMARTAAMGAAGAAAGAAVSALSALPDAYGVAIAAVGALVGSLAGTLLTRLERRSRPDGALRSHTAFVAVVAQPGEEGKSTQLLRDAGGRSMQRLRGRYALSGALEDDDAIEDPLRTGFPIP
jgi:hypothetical protein